MNLKIVAETRKGLWHTDEISILCSEALQHSLTCGSLKITFSPPFKRKQRIQPESRRKEKRGKENERLPAKINKKRKIGKESKPKRLKK